MKYIEKNINHIKTINTRELLRQNTIYLALSLKIFEDFLETNSFLVSEIYYDLSGMQFKFKNDYSSVDFIINNVELGMGYILESEEKLFVLEEHGTSFEELIYKHNYLTKTYKMPVNFILVSILNNNINLRRYNFIDGKIVYDNAISYSMNNFKVSKEKLLDQINPENMYNSYEIFPQADNMELIFDLFENLDSSEYSRSDIARILDNISGGLVDRQISYYISALLYLDILLETSEKKYKLTSFAIGIKQKSLKEKLNFVMLKILNHKVFGLVFLELMNNNILLPNKKVAEIIHREYPIKMKKSTALRRSSSVRNWVTWIAEHLY